MAFRQGARSERQLNDAERQGRHSQMEFGNELKALDSKKTPKAKALDSKISTLHSHHKSKCRQVCPPISLKLYMSFIQKTIIFSINGSDIFYNLLLLQKFIFFTPE